MLRRPAALSGKAPGGGTVLLGPLQVSIWPCTQSHQKYLLIRQMLFSGSELPVDDVEGSSFLTPGNSVKLSGRQWVTSRISLGNAGGITTQSLAFARCFSHMLVRKQNTELHFYQPPSSLEVTPLSFCLDLPLFNLTSKGCFHWCLMSSLRSNSYWVTHGRGEKVPLPGPLCAC